MNRRQFLLLGLAAAAQRFRLAVCNETFQNRRFADACRDARRTGYTGLEIAPYTLAEDPARLPVARRAELRRIMNSEGVEYVGLHNLLTSPAGLHATTPDAQVRRKTWDYLRALVELCADLGADGIMVFGSGKQRSADDPAAAARRLEEGLASLAPHARARGVTVLLEPLAPHLANVVTSLEQAVAIVRRIGSPAVQTMFDTHNAVRETAPHGDLIRKYSSYIRHVHLNEMDGRHPGTGSYDFRPVLKALKDCGYRGWVSLEVFDFSAGGEKIAADSARFLREVEAGLSKNGDGSG